VSVLISLSGENRCDVSVLLKLAHPSAPDERLLSRGEISATPDVDTAAAGLRLSMISVPAGLLAARNVVDHYGRERRRAPSH